MTDMTEVDFQMSHLQEQGRCLPGRRFQIDRYLRYSEPQRARGLNPESLTLAP